MARKSSRQIIEELLAKHEPLIRESFMRAIDEIRSSATLRVVVEALDRGDIEGAIASLQIEPAAFAELDRALRDAYTDGGRATVGNLPVVRGPDGNRVIWRFGVRDPLAEAWLRDRSSLLITRTTEDMKVAIRQRLVTGLQLGQNPRQTALDLVGRVSRASNRRVGGIIGLTSNQEAYVAAARRELLSGDAKAMRNYLTRSQRDRRFDRTVAKAIRDGARLDRALVDRIVGRYSDKLLKLRGDLIGLNETMAALARSRADAIAQQIAAGKIDAQDVTKIWRHTPQEHPRIRHQAMNGKSVAYGEKFELPNGVRMDYPHSDDAPISETAFCKCHYELKVDFFASVERRFRAEAA